MATKSILVDYLARVEGEGALDLRNHRWPGRRRHSFGFSSRRASSRRSCAVAAIRKSPDIVARICGICPIAYQMSAVHAIEDAFGVKVGRAAARAAAAASIAASGSRATALHVVMLHAPDFLGFPDGIPMAQDHGGHGARAASRSRRPATRSCACSAGREIHPVSVKAGGFHRVPTRAELAPLGEKLKRARDLAVGHARWVATFSFPDLERDYEFVAMRHPDEYPFNEGRLVSSRGLDIDIADYESEFEERHVGAFDRAAFRAEAARRLSGRPARALRAQFRQAARLRAGARRANAGLGPVCSNPFRSIIVRAVEIVYAFEEALRIIAEYEPPRAASVRA